MIELLWLLLPVAAASGWWSAQRQLNRQQQFQRSNQSAEYFRGLNYLLEDQPDKAIEIFLRMVEVDQDTAETHMALGNLFRRRGEVDRAIRIHQSLMSRESLSPEQRNKALLELGEDYMRAGLFDRAERLYRDLSENPTYSALALKRLASIYEQEKDWPQAIACYEQLERSTGPVRRLEIGQFYCELAEIALQEGEEAHAEQAIAAALEKHPECVRASMLEGYLALNRQQWSTAQQALLRIERQHLRYLPEILPALRQCYAELGQLDGYRIFLQRVYRQDPTGLLIATLAEELLVQGGLDSALTFLRAELETQPSFKGLSCLIELRLASQQPLERSDLEMLYHLSRQLFHSTVRYKCDNCGFIGKALHWRCPSCKTWSSIKPLPDVTCKTSY